MTLVLVGSWYAQQAPRGLGNSGVSLRRGENALPNGLIGIVLPSQGKSALLPPRFEANWVLMYKCGARFGRDFTMEPDERLDERR